MGLSMSARLAVLPIPRMSTYQQNATIPVLTSPILPAIRNNLGINGTLKFSKSSSLKVSLPKELSVLESLDQIHLHQTEITNRGLNIALMGSVTSTVALDVLNKKGTLLLKVQFARGDQPQDYNIDVYGLGEEKVHLAHMDLERSIQYRSFMLRVKSPPGHVICWVYELPGISHVVIIEDENRKTMLKVLTDGGIGWATSAKILNAPGDERLGRMYKKKEGSNFLRNSLHTAIHFPRDMSVAAKLTLMGTNLLLMGRYHL